LEAVLTQGFSQETAPEADLSATVADISLPVAVPQPVGVWGRFGQWATTGQSGIAIRGGAWSMGGYIAMQLFRTAGTLILARNFLGPEAFGIVGLVGVFLAGLGMFSELGISANVIQHERGDEPGFLNTAFSIQAARGAAIWIACTIAAYPVARFYEIPQLFPLLVAAGLSELLRGLTSTSAWTLTRHVNLRGITLLQIFSEVVAFGVCVAWAVLSPSAWALVVRTIVGAGVMALGTHFIARPPVKFQWDSTAARDILHFGGWISISTAAHFLGGQGERLFLGKFITPAELGCLSLAIMVTSVPASGISQLASQILLPLISKAVRNGREATIRDFHRSRTIFFTLSVVAAIGFLSCGNPFVKLVLSEKYRMAGWMLQLLGLRVALDLFATPASNLVIAYGKTKYSAAANVLRLMFMLGGVWFALVRFGIREAILALVIAQAISYLPLLFGISKMLPEVASREIRLYAVLIALLCSASLVHWPGN
jgi:O-antigen/teichoic acid export membrane protein